MKRSILLHIGMHKCGSTYLQQVLLRNRSALAEAGIAYPHEGKGHPGNAAGIETVSAKRLATLFGPHPRLALSFEDLITLGAKAKPFARAAAELEAEVEIIAFTRPFSEYIFGDYSQMMKQNFRAYIASRAPYDGRSFEQFVVSRARQMNPRAWMRAWTTTLPKARFTLASHRAIRATIEPLLNGAALNWEVPRDLTNPSLRTRDCDAIAAMIRAGAPSAEIVEAVKVALHEPAQPDAGRTPERIAWIEAVFERHNEALREEFGYDNSLVPA